MIYLLLNLFLNLELHRRSRYWTQPIYLCWGTNENWAEVPITKKSWALSPDVIQHVGRKKRWGWFLLQQWNTQNWWQAPLCNRAHCYILQCPISGLRKMYNGGWDERELIEKELSKKRKARFPLFCKNQLFCPLGLFCQLPTLLFCPLWHLTSDIPDKWHNNQHLVNESEFKVSDKYINHQTIVFFQTENALFVWKQLLSRELIPWTRERG